MYGSHSAGCEAGDPGGGPLPAGTCDHVQAGSKVSGRGGEEGGEEKREGREEGVKRMRREVGERRQGRS